MGGSEVSAVGGPWSGLGHGVGTCPPVFSQSLL